MRRRLWALKDARGSAATHWPGFFSPPPPIVIVYMLIERGKGTRVVWNRIRIAVVLMEAGSKFAMAVVSNAARASQPPRVGRSSDWADMRKASPS